MMTPLDPLTGPKLLDEALKNDVLDSKLSWKEPEDCLGLDPELSPPLQNSEEADFSEANLDSPSHLEEALDTFLDEDDEINLES